MIYVSDSMTVDEIAKLSLPEAYRLLLTLAEEDASSLTPKQRMQIRFGFERHFDLQLAMNDIYSVDSKNGSVSIGEVTLWLSSFYTEIEKRDALVRRLLIRGFKGKEPFTR